MSWSSARLIPALVFLLAFLPFVVSHHERPVPMFYEELAAILLGFGIVIAVAWRYGLCFGIGTLLPLGLVAVVGAQLLSSQPPHLQDALGFSLSVCWAVLLAAALRRYIVAVPEVSVARIVAVALTAAGAINGIAALLQVSVNGIPGVFYPIGGSGVTGNIAQRNLLVSSLFMGAVSAIYLHGDGRLKRVAIYSFLAIPAFGIVVAAARSASLYLLWVVITLLLSGRFPKSAARTRSVVAFILWLAFWQLLQPWLVSVLPGLGDASIVTRFKAEGMYDGMRRDLLEIAWSVFMEHPLLGAGVGSWDQWVFWRPLDAGTNLIYLTNIEHAHNIVAHMAAELGVAAVALLIWILMAFWRFQPADRATGWWVWCVAGILVLHSLVEYPLWYAHFLGIFVICFALAIPCERWRIRTSLGLKVGLAGISVVISIVTAITIHDYYRLETYPIRRLSGPLVADAFLDISRNPLIGHHARSFLAANISPAPTRLPEKVALCRRSIAEYADARVIEACLPIYRMAGLEEDEKQLRERMARNVQRYGPAVLTY